MKLTSVHKVPLETLTPDEREALLFIRRCLATAVKAAGGQRHVSGQTLLSVAPAVAQECFGLDARARLRAMGISSSAAFGKIVFALIAKGVLSKTATDRPEDFAGPSAVDEFLAGDSDKAT